MYTYRNVCEYGVCVYIHVSMCLCDEIIFTRSFKAFLLCKLFAYCYRE